MAVLGVFRGKDTGVKRAEDELKAKVSGKAATEKEEKEEEVARRGAAAPAIEGEHVVDDGDDAASSNGAVAAAPAEAPASVEVSSNEGIDTSLPRSVRIDMEKTVRVVTLDAPLENGFTEKDLREWSLNFSRPTVVRGLFTPPKLDSLESCEYFLPKKTKLFANVGKVGHFQDGNGSYTWEKLWSIMKSGRNVYGSFGTGTSNGGVDLGSTCMNNSIFSRSIMKMRGDFLPDGMFKKQEYPGHLIFGCSEEMKVSSNWHNAIDANLLFQLYGNKEWYTCENLPEEFTPFTVYSHANSVTSAKSKFRTEPNQAKLLDIFPQAAHLTLQPGDMLINPPFSWHAIKVDQMSISLSLRGDKEDVISWLAHRYFDGNIDHPMLLSFSHFFYKYHYTNLQWSKWNPFYNLGQFCYAGLLYYSPKAILIAYRDFAEKAVEMRKNVAEYFSRYE